MIRNRVCRHPLGSHCRRLPAPTHTALAFRQHWLRFRRALVIRCVEQGFASPRSNGRSRDQKSDDQLRCWSAALTLIKVSTIKRIVHRASVDRAGFGWPLRQRVWDGTVGQKSTRRSSQRPTECGPRLGCRCREVARDNRCHPSSHDDVERLERPGTGKSIAERMSAPTLAWSFILANSASVSLPGLLRMYSGTASFPMS